MLARIDAELAEFYEALFTSEFGHYRVFLALARKMEDAVAVEARWQQLLAAEAEILAAQEPGPKIHSGCGGGAAQARTVDLVRVKHTL